MSDTEQSRANWNTRIRDSVDSLLAQAGYQPDSSARHFLSMMNFDLPKPEVSKMTAERAAYFMDRFRREEKLLGPNERAAVDFVIDMLNAPTTIPKVDIRCETTDGVAHGITWLNIVRVEQEDDGSFTVVTDHWPTPKQSTWVGLTADEREQHRNDWHSNIHDKEFRAIEDKLKEKNRV